MPTSGLVAIVAILTFVVIILVAALVYVMKVAQDKENHVARPDARLIKVPGNKRVNLNTMVLNTFLDQADDAYMLAFQRSNVEYFIPYCTLPLAMSLNNRIIYCNDKVFGLQQHRTRKWSIIEVNEDSLTVRKDVTFDKIKERGKHAYMTYADPIKELWRIRYTPSRFQVQEVRDIV